MFELLKIWLFWFDFDFKDLMQESGVIASFTDFSGAARPIIINVFWLYEQFMF